MDNLGAAVEAVVDGGLEALPTVSAADHASLLKAAENMPELIIKRGALIRVLELWGDNQCTATDVQRWASFVRRGYVAAGARSAVRPIEIEYDTEDEDLIVEIIGRLDEIGDEVDGVVDDAERAEMLASLQESRS